MVLRAGGGIFITNVGGLAEYDPTKLINTIPGAYLSAGGVWTNASDSSLKHNFVDVDGESILSKLATLPIKQWSYKREAKSVKHLGPTAQDFHSTFGLGSDDRSISTVDPAGVALAAVKELFRMHRELSTKTDQVDELTEQVQGMREELDRLRGLLGLTEEP